MTQNVIYSRCLLLSLVGPPSWHFVENASRDFPTELSKYMVSRILIMNDEHNTLELFRVILESEGYEVYLSLLPLENVYDVEQISPSLIILDFKLGQHAQGMLMLQQLRMYAPTMLIPILICTAAVREMREQEETFHRKGIPVLYKPFDIGELLQAVHQLLLPPEKQR